MRTGTPRYLNALLMAVSLSFGLTQTLSAAALALKVETVQGQGPSIETPILATQCEGLGTLQFDLTYDPTIVEPQTVAAGGGLPSGLVEFDVLKPGVLGVAVVSKDPVNGPGELLRVRFEQVSPSGGRTELGIVAETAWTHKESAKMSVSAEAGFLSLKPKGTLSGGVTVVLVLVGIAVLAWLSFLIIAKARRTRRTPTPVAAAPVIQGATCTKCGAPQDTDAQFCTSCGQAITH